MDVIRHSNSKSETTRAAIIEHALGVSSRVGSRETLPLAVLASYRQRFDAQVQQPSQRMAPGLPRLRRLFDMSLKQVESGQATNSAGCF